MKVEPIGFLDGLTIWCERKTEVKNDHVFLVYSTGRRGLPLTEIGKKKIIIC